MGLPVLIDGKMVGAIRASFDAACTQRTGRAGGAGHAGEMSGSSPVDNRYALN
jgi:hypothetical protein